MEQQEIKTLRIIEALEKDDTQSQRDLSNNLGISLGLVNSLLKRIVNKGYFKVTTITKNRMRFALTPKGFAEKVTLTYRYISHAVGYYSEIRDKICEIVEKIIANKHKKIIIYGANELAEITSFILREYNLNLLFIVDDKKAGQRMFGLTIVDTSLLNTTLFDALIVANMDPDERSAIGRYHFPENKIFWI